MKWLILLIVISCGKPASQKFYQVDPASLGEDSDGDGMLDWDERNVGRDPYLADVDLNTQTPQEKITLIDDKGAETTFKAKPYRTIRKAILERIAFRSMSDIPLENFWKLQINHLRRYWESRLQGIMWKKTRSTLESGEELVSPVNAELSEDGVVSISNEEHTKELLKINQKTYRLILSLPEKEVIYHLHPSIDPLSFLQEKHKLVFDNAGQIIGVDKYQQDLPHPLSIDYSNDKIFWQASGWGLELRSQPQAGEVLVLAFLSVAEIKGLNLPDQNLSKLQNGSIKGVIGQKMSFTVFVPTTTQLNWVSRDESITWTMS